MKFKVSLSKSKAMIWTMVISYVFYHHMIYDQIHFKAKQNEPNPSVTLIPMLNIRAKLSKFPFSCPVLPNSDVSFLIFTFFSTNHHCKYVAHPNNSRRPHHLPLLLPPEKALRPGSPLVLFKTRDPSSGRLLRCVKPRPLPFPEGCLRTGHLGLPAPPSQAGKVLRVSGAL